jgi:hypothetical protein
MRARPSLSSLDGLDSLPPGPHFKSAHAARSLLGASHSTESIHFP